MSDSESDLDIKSAVLKKTARNAPPSPSDALKIKKITTKSMIVDALTELKTRKGVSVYAIKKFLTEKYNVDTKKVNYLIKKSLKAGVEDGSFLQMKGIGASGSFKLADVKVKTNKSKKIEFKEVPKKMAIEKDTKKTEQKKIEKTKKPGMVPAKKPRIEPAKTGVKDKKNKVANKKAEKQPKQTKEKQTKADKVKKTNKKAKSEDGNKTEKAKKIKVKSTKGMQTPAKKRAAMMKRKSIGSIIKPPKMKPRKE